VLLLVNDLDVRVITDDGELLRGLTLDPTKTYQPTGRPKGPALTLSWMSRDMCPGCLATQHCAPNRTAFKPRIPGRTEYSMPFRFRRLAS
jgi:hypothetical protein